MEPKPTWPSNECEAQRLIVEALRDAGWFVIVTAQDKSTRRQSSGLPDLLCWRHNHFVTFEVKSWSGRLRQSQRDFERRIRSHCGRNVDHYVIRVKEELPPWILEKE